MTTARNGSGARALGPEVIDRSDRLVLERLPHRGYAIRTPAGRRLGAIPPAADPEAGPWITIKPRHDGPVYLHRKRGLTGETVRVESAAGVPIAHVEWRALHRGFRYRVRSADRELLLDGRGGGDFEMDILDGGAAIGTLECELSPLVRRVIRLEPGCSSPGLRWGLLAAVLLADSKPRFFTRRSRRSRPAPAGGVPSHEPRAA